MSAIGLLRKFSTNSIKFSINKNAVGGRRLVEGVAVAPHGKTIVAWHPDPTYPYEFSKPLPTATESQSTSLMKEESLSTAMSAFKEKRPEVAREELMRLTHTTKHRWFPRSRDKKAKKTVMDRPYL
ncbi:large ribosomal subunit protein mL42 [Stomoxys calcitrans]|uniref:Large ribosomal subunit protein mL42 n=1 Tax=Stomoxys calcitrans TaxID=35570 RepID=A0A1I8Q6N7_STOCA|nr:large ribosomal subunit protein mL42 [Stomoxys calcitrans]